MKQNVDLNKLTKNDLLKIISKMKKTDLINIINMKNGGFNSNKIETEYSIRTPITIKKKENSNNNSNENAMANNKIYNIIYQQ